MADAADLKSAAFGVRVRIPPPLPMDVLLGEAIMNKMSMSHEDYLEAIVMLGGTTTTTVKSVDVANKLDVSKASVSKAVTYLRDNNYIQQAHYGDIALTQTGYDYGMAVYERHQLLTTFLTRAVGIPVDVAEDEACKMEHAISDESFKKWSAYIKGHNL